MAKIAKLEFVLTIRESFDNGGFRQIGHKIHYIKAGSFSGSALSYKDPGGGFKEGSDNKIAAWKTLATAIMGTRSLTLVMPHDLDMEKYYRAHTQLADAIPHVTINTIDPERQVPFDLRVEHSMDIFDVTVSPGIMTTMGLTSVGLFYSGSTKVWF